MFIQEAYKTGQEIRKVLKRNKKDITIVVYKLKETKNKFALCDEYLRTLIDNNLTAENNFMTNLLTEENALDDVKISLCLGIMGKTIK